MAHRCTQCFQRIAAVDRALGARCDIVQVLNIDKLVLLRANKRVVHAQLFVSCTLHNLFRDLT